MSKIRVHELAKELHVDNKKVLEYLNKEGLDIHNHMAGLEDGAAEKVRKKFVDGSKATEQPASAAPKAAPAAPAPSTPAAPATGNSAPAAAPTAPAAPTTSAPTTSAPAPSQGHPAGARPQGDRPQGQGQRPPYDPNRPRPTGDRPQGQGQRPPYDPNRPRPTGDRPQGQGQRPPYDPNRPRPTGDRPPYDPNRPRPTGDRPPYDPNRPRPTGDRPPYDPNRPRPQGDRPQGNRPPYDPNRPRPTGDRPPYDPNRPRPAYDPNRPRPTGDRPPYDPNRPRPAYDPNRPRPAYDPNRPRPAYDPNRPRPTGDRPPYDPNRPRPQGGGQGRPYDPNRPRPQGDRPYGQGGGQGGQGQRSGGGQRSSGGLNIPQPEVREEKPTRIQRVEPKKDNSRGKEDGHKRKQVKSNLAPDLDRPITKLMNEFLVENEELEMEIGGKVTRPKSKRADAKQQRKEEARLAKATAAIPVPAKVTVGDFASLLSKSPNEIIMRLMQLGTMATINQEIEYDMADLIASDLGLKIELDIPKDEQEQIDLDAPDNPEDMVSRPPIVTVMGHVDHGKTSLLDAIRATNVTGGEAGGITQHIGASEAFINGKRIVFLDTPGHEAFTSLRARGAKVTDIAILVVAADDGVMPQTIEAIDHAKAAGVPIIVALNKIDKANADQDRVKKELADHGLLVEDWGGEVVCVPLSAKQGENIDTLLEMVLLVADMADLKANPKRPARGTVIEAQLEKGRGPVATILIETGTLNVGDPLFAGPAVGRIRAMYNYKCESIKASGPATCVEITGLDDVPQAGDRFYVTRDDKQAREIAERKRIETRESGLRSTKHVSLEDLFDQIKTGNMKDLNIIVKADVHGSIEALKGSLVKLSNEEVRVNVIHSSIGTITESDIMLASASNALIIGFNVRPMANVSRMAEQENVSVKTYRIIYEAINDVETAMKGMLDPIFKEVVLGKVQVRELFKVPNLGVIAGAYVTEGKVARNANVRVIRAGIVIHDGKISSLKRFKDDAKEVNTGYECGIGIANFNDLKIDDEIEAFIIEEVKRT